MRHRCRRKPECDLNAEENAGQNYDPKKAERFFILRDGVSARAPGDAEPELGECVEETEPHWIGELHAATISEMSDRSKQAWRDTRRRVPNVAAAWKPPLLGGAGMQTREKYFGRDFR